MIVRPLWKDDAGRQRQPQFWVGSQEDGHLVAVEMSLWSTAAMELVRYTTIEAIGETGTGGPALGVNDIADLSFTTPYRNGRAHIIIPAPVEGMFKLDGETVDPVAASDLIDAVLGYCRTPGGLSLNGFAGGYRRRLTPPR